MSEPIVIATNGAVFINRSRRHRDARITFDPDTSTILVARISQPSVVIDSYKVVEVVKTNEAYDGFQVDGADQSVIRIACQSGCGCGGQKPYAPDDSYSGLLDEFGREITGPAVGK